MTTYPGQNGSVSFNASVIAELKSWTLECSNEILDDTSMGDDWRTHVGGLGSWGGTATAHLDYDGVGQGAAIDELATASPAGTARALIFLVATGKTFTGNCLITSFSVNQTMGDIVEVTFDFTGTAALSMTWT